MPVKNAGENYDLNNTCILQIDSPRDKVRGPHVVAYHTPLNGDRWAIVALDWDEHPALGMRWFWGPSGHPNSKGYATWFIIPGMLHEPIVGELVAENRLSSRRGELLRRFLEGEIDGDDEVEGLRQLWNNP